MPDLQKLIGNTLIGADPEIFARSKVTGKIVGSERFVPDGKNIVVRDGIQVELNPPASVNATVLNEYIDRAFKFLDTCVKGYREPLELVYDTVVDVTREELDSLSEKSRVLGCMPSSNIYGNKPITVDPTTYTLRSAGGHLHFGLQHPDLFDERVRLISWMDVFVGLYCVLLDRDKNAPVRRENYGRAGEYRITPYGVEYRTLSNFWLQAPSLLRFVVEQANYAIKVVADGINGGDLESKLIDIVDPKLVVKAIDTNDFGLALDLINKIQNAVKPLATNEFVKFIKVANHIEKSGLVSLVGKYRSGGIATFYTKSLF